MSSLRCMKPSLSCGPGGLPPAILKIFVDILVPLLTAILSKCIKTNVFPRPWKMCRVRPIFKSGNKSDAANYTADSVICVFSSLFETAQHKVLSGSVQNFLNSKQHGFISGRSTTDLACFTEQASAAVSARGQFGVVYRDLSKAFVVACHALLLEKLLRSGIGRPLVALLRSYQTNNQFRFVRISRHTFAMYRST